jgi:hypothetical protein
MRRSRGSTSLYAMQIACGGTIILKCWCNVKPSLLSGPRDCNPFDTRSHPLIVHYCYSFPLFWFEQGTSACLDLQGCEGWNWLGRTCYIVIWCSFHKLSHYKDCQNQFQACGTSLIELSPCSRVRHLETQKKQSRAQLQSFIIKWKQPLVITMVIRDINNFLRMYVYSH